METGSITCDVKENMYACFTEDKKAFDKDQHSKLMKLLANKTVDPRGIYTMQRLHRQKHSVSSLDTHLAMERKLVSGDKTPLGISKQEFSIDTTIKTDIPDQDAAILFKY